MGPDMKLKASLILSLTILFYSLLYLATSKVVPCEDDCAKIAALDTTLVNKYKYVSYAYRCARSYSIDTLCVFVKDTAGINWNLFADTVCLYANSVGLYQQEILLIKISASSADTVAKKKCP